jgi:hypothetical protein
VVLKVNKNKEFKFFFDEDSATDWIVVIDARRVM